MSHEKRRCGSCSGTGVQTIVYTKPRKNGQTSTRICNSCHGKGVK